MARNPSIVRKGRNVVLLKEGILMIIMPRYGMVVGPDGSGKTTIVSRLKKDLFNLPVATVREPGGTPFGEEVRGLFEKFPNLPAATKLHLMLAARTMLKPAIEQLLEKNHVISDRGFPCTYAFQILGEKSLDLERMYWASVSSESVLKPHFIIILDVDVHTGMERMRVVRGDVGIKEFDGADFSFKQRVRNGYQDFEHAWATRREGYPRTRIHHVDASGSPDEVYAKVREICVKEF